MKDIPISDEISGMLISKSEMKFDNKLGEGAFGVVFKGSYKNKTIAIKQLKGNLNESSMTDFQKEVGLISYEFQSFFLFSFFHFSSLNSHKQTNKQSDFHLINQSMNKTNKKKKHSTT